MFYMVTVKAVKEPGRDVEGTVETMNTITLTVSYEQMLGDIFGHRKDIDEKRNKTKSHVSERKIPMPRNLFINSSLLEDTSEPQLAITSEAIPSILLKTSHFPKLNQTEDVPNPDKPTPETSTTKPALSNGVIGGCIGAVVEICLVVVVVVVLVKKNTNANPGQSRQDSHRKHKMVQV
jgi:hypothetical protein